MKKDSTFIAALNLLVAFHFLNIIHWYNADFWPLGKDCLYHLNNACRLIQDNHIFNNWRHLVFIDTGYPPFYYWTSFLLWKIFNSYKILFLNSTLYFIALIYLVYAIGKILYNKQTALTAAILCSLFPCIYRSAMEFNLELATATMVALIVYFLLKSDNFSNSIFSVLAGFAVLCGLLTRQLTMTFAIGPIVFTLLGSFFEKEPNNKINTSKSRNIIIFFLISSLSLIYYYDMQTFENLWKRIYDPGMLETTNIFSFSHLAFYLRALPEQIGWLGVILFFFGLFYLEIKKKSHKYLLFSWIGIAFLIQTFIRAKCDQYTLAYLPAAALVVALAIERIKNSFLKKFVSLGIIIIYFCNYFLNF